MAQAEQPDRGPWQRAYRRFRLRRSLHDPLSGAVLNVVPSSEMPAPAEYVLTVSVSVSF